MSWDRLQAEEELKDQIRIMARMINTLEPKNEAELIAAALPNLLFFLFEREKKVRQTVMQTLEEELGKIAKEKASILGGEGYSGVPILMEITEVMDIVRKYRSP